MIFRDAIRKEDGINVWRSGALIRIDTVDSSVVYLHPEVALELAQDLIAHAREILGSDGNGEDR